MGGALFFIVVIELVLYSSALEAIFCCLEPAWEPFTALGAYRTLSGVDAASGFAVALHFSSFPGALGVFDFLRLGFGL